MPQANINCKVPICSTQPALTTSSKINTSYHLHLAMPKAQHLGLNAVDAGVSKLIEQGCFFLTWESILFGTIIACLLALLKVTSILGTKKLAKTTRHA